jgi:hypothetical protein
MNRRNFLAASLAAPALAQAQSENKSPEYYELRRYRLRSGPGRRLTDGYLREALVPALNRLGMEPVGVFSQDIGEENPSMFVLIPSASAEALAGMQAKLDADSAYTKAAASFLNTPAKEPAYERVESTLLRAFPGWPKLTVPPVTAQHGARVFELRTYESPTDQDHRRKVEMFHSGEFEIFRRAGFWQVFYGDALIGPRLPRLTYMLAFADAGERNKLWKAFGSDPEWKKLTASPRFSFEDIVSNISNLILSPTAYSQV